MKRCHLGYSSWCRWGPDWKPQAHDWKPRGALGKCPPSPNSAVRWCAEPLGHSLTTWRGARSFDTQRPSKTQLDKLAEKPLCPKDMVDGDPPREFREALFLFLSRWICGMTVDCFLFLWIPKARYMVLYGSRRVRGGLIAEKIDNYW